MLICFGVLVEAALQTVQIASSLISMSDSIIKLQMYSAASWSLVPAEILEQVHTASFVMLRFEEFNKE
jgi:hypothetical protein